MWAECLKQVLPLMEEVLEEHCQEPAEPVEDLLLQVWAEVLEFHLQLKVQEEAHLMVHPIHQKKVEEVNQQEPVVFPQEELEEVGAQRAHQVGFLESVMMIHQQKTAEEANQQVGLLQEERALGVIHQFLPHQKKEQVVDPREAQQNLLREVKWVVIQVIPLH